ncbi:hypothetical protein KCU91_g342, partial [Aureobasidium melanogenum]
MDTLPLELKQRICSYLTPKDLKSLRLTSKIYSVAACRYLLRRVFLINHPDSCQEALDIANHPELCHSVTTLIVDTSCLRSYPKYEQWARVFVEVESNPADPTNSERAEGATVKLSARSERVLRRQRNSERWTSYEERAHTQRTDASIKLMLTAIALIFQKCSKLSNLVLDSHRGRIDDCALVEKRQQFLSNILGSTIPGERFGSAGIWIPMRFTLGDIFKPVHDANRALNSLVLLDPGLETSQMWKPPALSILQSLKHFRQSDCSPDILTFVVASAPNLESFGTIERRVPYTSSLSALMSIPPLSKLRACSLSCARGRDDLAGFLLRHASTLQQLRVCNGRSYDPGYWNSFSTQIKGKLRNLRRVELVNIEIGPATYNAETRLWSYNLMAEKDILQDHEHELETGSAQVYDGLWEDYEQLFFPEKIKT